MTTYPFTINGFPFYATEEPNWQPYGVIDAYSVLGVPITSGPGSFTVKIRAIPYVVFPGDGDPLHTGGTFYQLFSLWKDSLAVGGVQIYSIFNPHINDYFDVTGILNIAKLVSNMAGGMSNPDVVIEVNNAFLSDADRTNYFGGSPNSSEPPPYIPGDPLPTPDPLKTYGWQLGRWNYGYWTRGEGV